MPAFRGLETHPTVNRFKIVRIKQILLCITGVHIHSMVFIIRIAYYTGPDCKLLLAFLLRAIFVKHHAQYIGVCFFQ